MQNLISIYSIFNDVLDHYEKSMNEANKLASETVRKIILDKTSYTDTVTDVDINSIDAIFTHMVNTMERNENVLYINHCAIVSSVMDALFFKGDFELLDILRGSKPFSLLSSEAKKEIKGILELFQIHETNEMDFFGNAFYQFYNSYELPKREMTCNISRQFKGMAA